METNALRLSSFAQIAKVIDSSVKVLPKKQAKSF